LGAEGLKAAIPLIKAGVAEYTVMGAAEGRMRAAGLARVEDAKASGRWKAAYSSDAAPRMTADVRQALERADALGAFRRLSPSRRLQLLHWIGEAKRAATRTRRIGELPDLVRENRLPGFQSA
jgi:uncharacterized protein YdeI (YjbR/CyaY-like superfamily)